MEVREVQMREKGERESTFLAISKFFFFFYDDDLAVSSKLLFLPHEITHAIWPDTCVRTRKRNLMNVKCARSVLL